MSDRPHPGSQFTTGLSVAAGTPLIGKSGITGRTYPYALAAITRHAALYAVRFVGPDDAPDVAQVVVRKLDLVFQADPSYPGSSTPLIDVVRKLTTAEAKAFRKKKASRRRAEGTHAVERAQSIAIQLDPERTAHEADMRAVVEVIRKRVSPVTFDAFTLNREEGYTTQQVAEAQHTPHRRAMKRIGKALHVSRIVCAERDIPAPPPLGKPCFVYPEPKRTKPKGGGRRATNASDNIAPDMAPDMPPRDEDDERLGMTAADEEQLCEIVEYLSGEMPLPELDAFVQRLNSDDELRADIAMMEQLWATPRLATSEQETGVVPESRPATSPPRKRPRIRTLIDVGTPVLLGAGWVFYILFPRLPGGTEVEMTSGNQVVAEQSPLGQLMPNPHVVATESGQMTTFALPGKSTILLRPRSRFVYQGDWAPEMTGTLHGEGVLDVPDGTTWTVYGHEGAVMLGPGRHALYNDQKDHVFRTRVVSGWAAWGKDTVSAGDGVFIETRSSGGPLKVVEDGSRFPKASGRDAVDRGERYLPAPSFWDMVRGRPSDKERETLLEYMARMSAEERKGGAGMPADITMGEALDEQRAFERGAAEKAALAPQNEAAQTPGGPASPPVTATATSGTRPPERVTMYDRPACDRCTIELQRIATLSAGDTVEYITPASTAARDSRGRYYVLGAKGAFILFRSDGLFLRRVSAPGWSGERRSIIGFAVGPGDSLHVADSSGQVAVLDPNSFMSVRTFPIPGALTEAAVAADGRLLLGVSPRVLDSMRSGTHGGNQTPSAPTAREGGDGLLWTTAPQVDADSATRIEVTDPARRQTLASAVFPRTGVIDWNTYYRIRADGRGGFVVDVFKAQLRRP